MPELPEVETIVRVLRPKLIGRTILDVDVRWPRTVATPSVRQFKRRVRGQVITGVSRRAKYLVFQLQPTHKSHDVPYSLIIHLRMSGDLLLRESKIKPGKYDRLILTLSVQKSITGDGDNRALVFMDTRKFGRVWLTPDSEEVLGRLGPEPFGDEFTPQWLYQHLSSRHRQLKPLLLDQTFIAGLGNIYADECLHMAKLHPLALSSMLKPRHAEALHNAIRSVLEQGIRWNGASIDWAYRGGEYQNHFRVYDRTGKACPVCGRKIQKLVVGQRGTHICPNCQKLR
jgi:formamidopyrimidine-DNA glycosylase